MSNLPATVVRLKELQQKHEFILGLLKEKQRLRDEKSQQFKSLTSQIELDAKVIEVLKKVIEAVSYEGLTYLKDLVTRGLQVVFTDDVYALDIEISDRGSNKTVEFFIEDSRGVRSELSDCGSGIQSVTSFIFQVYFILKLGLPRILFLDEAFSRLSVSYTEGLMEFMGALKKELGFKILWSTHGQNIISSPVIDKIYEVSKGEIKEVEK